MSPHKPQPISRAALARRAGRDRAAVTRAALRGGPLAAAVLPRKRIDAAHPATVAWLDQRDAPAATDELDLDAVGHLAVSQAVALHGTEPWCRDFVDALKLIADAQRLRLHIAAEESRLVSRELVRSSVFGYLDRLTATLLGPAVPAMARRCVELTSEGEPVEALQLACTAIVSRALAAEKAEAARALRRGAAELLIAAERIDTTDHTPRARRAKGAA